MKTPSGFLFWKGNMIQKPKGTKDIYGTDQDIYESIFKCFEKLAKSYNFHKISTPIFESLALFRETSGEFSDIFTKELYSFKDLSNRELALRPEGTAPIGRAIIENKLLTNKLLNKLFYVGPMFRYEKPQKGRLRQFYQIGVELIGDNYLYSTIEIIQLASNFLNQLGINDCILKINNIGTKSERQLFEKSLTKYFEENKKNLSELSISRIQSNPLRILDDKIDSQKQVVINAPKIEEFLSSESKESFKNILSLLTEFGISFQVDPALVRGLNYYTNVVFEFESHSQSLGSKSTIIGGGCYDNLINNSSQNIFGVGFGVGVERIFEILKDYNEIKEKSIDVYFLISNQDEFLKLFPLICELRNNNIIVDFNKKFNKSQKLYSEALYFKPKQIVYYEQSGNKKLNIITIKQMSNNVKIEVDINEAVKSILKGKTNENK
ncbi:MAG: histidine--tRNA ligase [Metamycoplasmataceae bacterium]